MTDTPWKTEDWFTSPWNFDPEVTKDWKFSENIKIHDVTLRDGEQQAEGHGVPRSIAFGVGVPKVESPTGRAVFSIIIVLRRLVVRVWLLLKTLGL